MSSDLEGTGSSWWCQNGPLVHSSSPANARLAVQVPEQPRQGLGDKTVWFLPSRVVLSSRTERWQQPHAAISDALFMVLISRGHRAKTKRVQLVRPSI